MQELWRHSDSNSYVTCDINPDYHSQKIIMGWNAWETLLLDYCAEMGWGGSWLQDFLKRDLRWWSWKINAQPCRSARLLVPMGPMSQLEISLSEGNKSFLTHVEPQQLLWFYLDLDQQNHWYKSEQTFGGLSGAEWDEMQETWDLSHILVSEFLKKELWYLGSA